MAKKRSKVKTICSAITGIICMLSVIVYLIVGLCTKMWHPMWMIIVCSVAAAAIIDIIANTVTKLQEQDDDDKNPTVEVK